ncbi:MAG: hypothetical protein JW941_05830 [Candidatus Coatesbacteria bacterium]|nr:hypothetical protein [Candidatus Coatesbacteria bacterium]
MIVLTPTNETIVYLIHMVVIPEIVRRHREKGLAFPLVLERFQILFRPDSPLEPTVRINKEVKGIFQAELKEGCAPKSDGDPLAYQEVSRFTEYMEPDDKDIDCAHISVILDPTRPPTRSIRLEDPDKPKPDISFGLTITWYFDYRWRRGEAKAYLKKGMEFREASKSEWDQGRKSAALDNFFSAAELIALSRLLIFAPDERLVGPNGHGLIRNATSARINAGHLDDSYLKLGEDAYRLRDSAR